MRADHALLASTLAALLFVTAGAQAAAPKHEGAPKRDPMMLHLDPTARVEQRCNARAMGMISREHQNMRPDELVAYAFADTRESTDTVAATGAAVRSAGHWYHLSYHCQTSADGMDIKSLTYDLGREVPRADWSAHYLVP